MASEIRVNQIQSRTGVSTISFTETGPIISGVTTITGDLDVTGLVSYDDVTNIDSVGIITARDGLHVTGGSVGIGTDTPIGNLHLNYNGNNGTSFRMENFEGYSTFHNDGGALYVDSGQHIFRNEDGSSERFRIDSSARVIIDGSTSGNNKLQINGTGNDTAFVRLKRTNGAGDDSAYGGINVIDNNDVTIGTAEFRNQDSTTRSQFVLSTYNVTTGGLAEALRVRADGKVGINEAAPDRQLHVKSGANSADGVIRIESATSNIMDMGTDGTGHFINCVNPDPFSIKISGTEKFRIDSTGQVTLYDSPGIKLSVKTSSLYAQDGTLSYYGTNNGVYLNGAGPDGFLRLNAAGSNNENYHNTIDIMGSNAGAYIMFRSQNNERLRIVNSVAATVHVKGETALTGTTGDAKGFSIATGGGTSCPLYFGNETHSAQKSMYLYGYWIYLRGHQNEGIRFVFSQGSGNAPRSDQYQFKYNQATRPTGNTTWDGFSDRRAKENVQDVTSALDTIGRLRPVTFDWTNDYADRMNMFNMDKTDPKSYNWFSVKENGYDESRKNNNVGFIAQEFEEVFPKDITETEMELGDETITDFKTVNFDSLVPMLTKAVQELKAENDSLRARLDAAGL